MNHWLVSCTLLLPGAAASGVHVSSNEDAGIPPALGAARATD